MADLYLCLDLAPAADNEPQPPGDSAHAVMVDAVVNGPRWRRNWCAFKTR